MKFGLLGVSQIPVQEKGFKYTDTMLDHVMAWQVYHQILKMRGVLTVRHTPIKALSKSLASSA